MALIFYTFPLLKHWAGNTGHNQLMIKESLKCFSNLFADMCILIHVTWLTKSVNLLILKDMELQKRQKELSWRCEMPFCLNINWFYGETITSIARVEIIPRVYLYRLDPCCVFPLRDLASAWNPTGIWTGSDSRE